MAEHFWHGLGRFGGSHLGLGLRHGHDRRHHDDRRATPREDDRRHGDRRRFRLRTLLLAAATMFGAPHAISNAMSRSTSSPRVEVSMDDFRPIPAKEAYEGLIQEAAAAYRLDPALIRAVMQTESAFDTTVVSRVGAQGLMQLMPSLAQEMGVVDSFDPRENIMAGARYLRELLDRHRGNVPLALASYNAGPTAVAKYGHVPPFRETQRYVKQITKLVARDHDATN